MNEERSSTNQEESQSSWIIWEDYHLWLALRRFTDRDVDICYERIKTDKTEQDWSFNQFAVNASKFFA